MDTHLAAWRRITLSLLLVAVSAAFLWTVNRHYAIGDWLVWRYVAYWLSCGALLLGCLGTGEAVVMLLVGRIRGLHAHSIVCFCTGLLIAGLAIFIAGMLQWLRPWFFYGLPAALLGIGFAPLRRRYERLRSRIRRGHRFKIVGAGPALVILFGMYCWLMLYAGVMTPDNVMFDSQWKHLAISESFAAHGGIFRFGQGDLFAARPHFASYLYTWAFLIPGGQLFDRITLCGHLEFLIFVVTTIVGIPAMVRRLVPNADPKLVWVTRFLFPGVFLYDSNLSIGADHIAATFAVPIFLLAQDLIRRRFDLRYAALLAAMLAGPVLTKETAAAVLIPGAAAATFIGALVHVYRLRRTGAGWGLRYRWLGAFGVILVVGLVCSSPLWLKNLIWYGDPLYPNLRGLFAPRPWSPDSEYMFRWGYADFQFASWRSKAENPWLETLGVLFTWSLEPHDWSAFHGKRPVIGSLMTMLLPCLLLLPRPLRLWAVAGWVHLGILTWFRLLPQDRYLQALMPWMAAWTAAVMILAWRHRIRAALIVVVAAQILWGADVYFLHRNMLPKLVKLFSASRDPKKLEQRLHTQGNWEQIGEYLPPGSRLMVHEVHPHLGTNVPTYTDFQTWQYGWSYGLMRSPRELWEAYRSEGISHIWWGHQRSRAWDSIAGDIMFFDMAVRLSVNRKRFGKSWVAELPPDPPESEAQFEDTVAVIGCRPKSYASGLYRLRDLAVPMFGPDATVRPPPRVATSSTVDASKLAHSASYVVVDPSCKGAPKQPPRGFKLAARRPKVTRVHDPSYEIYVRVSGRPKPHGAWKEPPPN